MVKSQSTGELPKRMKRYEKMYECSACETVFIIIMFRAPKSMPCLHEPLHCPFCMVSASTLVRIHKSLPDRKRGTHGK